MMIRKTSNLFAVLATSGLFLVSTAVAQQAQPTQANQSDSRNSVSNQQNQQSETSDNSSKGNMAKLPDALKSLDLKSEQKEQIRQALQQHNDELQNLWSRYNQQLAQAVELEAAWVAAVRDTLSNEDQQRFDENRMQDRNKNSVNSSTGFRGNESAAGGSESAVDRTNRESRNSSRTFAPDAQRPEDQGQRNRRFARERNQRENAVGTSDTFAADENQANSRDNSQPQSEFAEPDFVVITVTSPTKYTQGTRQSDSQKQECSEVCRQYRQKLTTTWGKIHELHNQLVQIEADRIQMIERHLTDEQLQKLRKDRSQASQVTASTDSTGSTR